MSLTEILLLAFGLSMDAFAVSIACGINSKDQKLKTALKISILFGFFQALMPVFGFYLGKTFLVFVESFGYLIAFAILSAIGLKMATESLSRKTDRKCIDTSSAKIVLSLSLATSMDAFACGVSLGVISSGIFLPSVIIGIVTFFVSFFGVFIGERFGREIRNFAELVGGVMLIGIGIKMLLEGLL